MLEFSTLTSHGIRSGSLLPELLGEPDENPFGTPDVAEPIHVFILDHFANEFRARESTGKKCAVVRLLHPLAHIDQDLADGIDAHESQARIFDVQDDVYGESDDAGEADLVHPVVRLLSRGLVPGKERRGEREA